MICDEDLQIDIRNSFLEIRKRVYLEVPEISDLESLKKIVNASKLANFNAFPYPKEELLWYLYNWVYKYLQLIRYMHVFESATSRWDRKIPAEDYPYLIDKYLFSVDEGFDHPKSLFKIIEKEAKKHPYHKDMKRLIFYLFLTIKHQEIWRDYITTTISFPMVIKEIIDPFVTNFEKQEELCLEIIGAIKTYRENLMIGTKDPINV